MVQEQPARVERRLAAILAAYVAGYSRLLGDRDHHASTSSPSKPSSFSAARGFRGPGVLDPDANWLGF
jgi:hypothetical protein